ncbi:MAG: Rrf2 family transcriptional regulator [Verrucomicrobiota bacterium]
MRLPLKTEYACQVLAQLAKTPGPNGMRQVDDLATAEGLSPNYSVQILTSLRQAGLVESRRGKNGGYLLARHPQEITLADIAKAIEGLPLIESSGGNGGESADRVREAWDRANGALEAACREITLEELAVTEDGGDWVI